jgi:hypothetical protein
MSRLSEGKKIGGWTCIERLGEGGNADVWKVEHEDGRLGAMKVVRDQRPDKTQYARFVREIQTLRGLTPRPGVLDVIDDHLPDEPSKNDFAWMVMPLAEPLREALRGRGVADIVAAVADVAATLADLHAAGLAHRDIKPENLYWYEDRPAVGDFGLVELPDAETLTVDGRIPGAFGYITDEVLADPANADWYAADVFALGKCLWVLETDNPFAPQGHIAADGGAATLSRRIVVGDIDVLDRMIDRATAPAPVRFTMREFAAELEAYGENPRNHELPTTTAEALQRARDAMQETFTVRDAERARRAAFEEASSLVRTRSEELFDVVQRVDNDAETGPFANNAMQALTEPLGEMGGPSFEHHTHWGVRIQKGSDFFPSALLLDFGVAIDTAGVVHLWAFGFAGPTEVMGGTSAGPYVQEAPMSSLQLERGVDELVALLSDELPRLLDEFTAG